MKVGVRSPTVVRLLLMLALTGASHHFVCREDLSEARSGGHSFVDEMESKAVTD